MVLVKIIELGISNWPLLRSVSATEIGGLEGNCFGNGRNESRFYAPTCDSSAKAGVCLCCEK